MADGQRPAYWYGDARVPLLARLLSGLYAGVAALRRGLYAKRWLRRDHPGVPVVVVGNISVGGTGKTPLTIALVERLRAEGCNPGVASRGYGREGTQPLWVDADSDPAETGDEPALIARSTPVKIRVDRNRAAAARALAESGCDVVVCDDGLQHYALTRDVEIEVIDGRRRYGNAQLLPAGPLREPVERAQRCDFRVVNLGGVMPGNHSHAGAGFGEWPMRLLVDQATPIAGGRARPLASFAGQRVHAVAGIGDPERFFGMLRGFGIAVVPHAFADHHRYRAEDFQFGSRLPVLMTAKDAIKCGTFAADDWFSVPVRAELPEAFWVALLAKVRSTRA